MHIPGNTREINMSFLFGKMTHGKKMMLILAVTFVAVVVLNSTALMSFYNKLIEEKREKTMNVVEVAYGVVDYYYNLYKKGEMSEETAKKTALKTINGLRYGKGEGYFFIIDWQYKVLVQPQSPALVDTDASALKDPNGKMFIAEFVDIAKNSHSGFVDYMWPKPGSDGPVRKISYVVGFEPWNWLIGSGIYTDDVSAASWRKAVMLGGISLLSIVIIMIVAYVSLAPEQKE
jgi:methyl-accepting chemotaxis protein